MINLAEKIIIVTSDTRQNHNSRPNLIPATKIFSPPFTLFIEVDLDESGYLFTALDSPHEVDHLQEISLKVDTDKNTVTACMKNEKEEKFLSLSYKKNNYNKVVFSLDKSQAVLCVDEAEISCNINIKSPFLQKGESYLGSYKLYYEPEKRPFKGSIKSFKIFNRRTLGVHLEPVDRSLICDLDFHNRTPWRIFDRSQNRLHGFWYNREEFK